jgi:hypothetical protein
MDGSSSSTPAGGWMFPSFEDVNGSGWLQEELKILFPWVSQTSEDQIPRLEEILPSVGWPDPC